MAEDKVLIELDLETGGFKKKVGGLETSAKKSGMKIGGLLSSPILKSSKAALTGFATQLAAVGGIIATAFAGRAVIDAAKRQEEAVHKMNVALAQSGEFSVAASKDMQEFASQLENTTKFGDESTLEMLALAKAMGSTNEGAKKLVKTAMDLSVGSGGFMSVESAVKNLAKTLGGLTGELGETLPMVRGLTAEQLKAGAAIDMVAAKFLKASEAEIKTFGGAMGQLENTWGSFLEVVGDLIIKSPIIIKAISKVSEFLKEAAGSLQKTFEGKDVIRDTINEILKFGLAVNTWVVMPLEVAANVFGVVFDTIKVGFNAIVNVAAQAFGKILQLLGNFTDKFKEAELATQTVVEATGNNIDELAGRVDAGFATMFETPFTEKAEAMIMDFQNFVAQVEPTMNNGGAQMMAAMNSGMKSKAEETVTTWRQFLGLIKAEMKKTSGTIQTQAVAVANILKGSFVGGVTNAFSAFGAAVAKGENAFNAFGKSVIGTLGDIAIKMGSMIIAAAAGFAVLPGFQANSAAAFAQGAALIALGGALKAFSGSGGGGGGVAASTGGGATASSGISGGDISTDVNEIIAANEEVEEKKNTNVTVNVSGVVTNPRETAQQIADLLRDGFDSNDISIDGALT